MLNQLTSNGVLSFSCPISAAYLRSKQPDSELIAMRCRARIAGTNDRAQICLCVPARFQPRESPPGLPLAALVGPGVLSQRRSR